jgi:hypothetical protein
VGTLTESRNPQVYWRKPKQGLEWEGDESVTNYHALKMVAEDGEMRLTDIAKIKKILRLIQSIAFKKSEPFKIYLAEVGNDFLSKPWL